jgi:hypothetical protein
MRNVAEFISHRPRGSFAGSLKRSVVIDIYPDSLHTSRAAAAMDAGTSCRLPCAQRREVDVSHGIQSFKDGSRLVLHLALRRLFLRMEKICLLGLHEERT